MIKGQITITILSSEPGPVDTSNAARIFYRLTEAARLAGSPHRSPKVSVIVESDLKRVDRPVPDNSEEFGLSVD